MVAPGQFALRSFAAGGGNEEFIGPEPAIALPADRHAKHLQDRVVEAPAGVDVADHQLQVIDQPSAMQVLGFHVGTP